MTLMTKGTVPQEFILITSVPKQRIPPPPLHDCTMSHQNKLMPQAELHFFTVKKNIKTMEALLQIALNCHWTTNSGCHSPRYFFCNSISTLMASFSPSDDMLIPYLNTAHSVVPVPAAEQWIRELAMLKITQEKGFQWSSSDTLPSSCTNFVRYKSRKRRKSVRNN